MPRGDKSGYTDKQDREADHIAELLFFNTGGEGRVTAALPTEAVPCRAPDDVAAAMGERTGP